MTTKIVMLFRLAAIAIAITTPLKAFANDELAAVNAIVEQQAQHLDAQYGLLMTLTERNALKIKVIAQKLVDIQSDNPQMTTNDLLDEGIVTYEITDIVEQRQLLIELEPQSNGGGIEPQGNGGGIAPPIGQ